jgi:uncharacterized RDD family membrane protein YckC
VETAPSVPPPSPIVIEPQIAGFWQRFFGFWIDGILLGLVGCGLGFFFFDYFANLGALGRIIGFVIALLYFVPLNSRIGSGRTIGKFLVRTRVVGRDGKPVGLGRSFIRYLVLAIPFLLNGAPLPPSIYQGPLLPVLSVVVFGLGGSIIYLLIFNARTRQSLHDLIAGTYVVGYSSELDPVTVKVWRGHIVPVCLIMVIAVAVPFATRPLMNTDFFKPILALQERIMKEPEVSYATVFEGTTKFRSNKLSVTKSLLTVTVKVRQKPADFDQEADKIAAIVLSGDYPRALEKDRITISVVYGFDIGIARLWSSRVVPHSPKEWQDRLYPLSRKKK